MDTNNNNDTSTTKGISYINRLPNEVQEGILFYLSRRSLVHCSAINKHWHQIISQPKFYSNIELYTFKQWEKFINTAREFIIQDKPMGHHVQQLTIYFDNKAFINFFERHKSTLPNIRFMNNPVKDSLALNKHHYDFSFIKQLTQIPNQDPFLFDNHIDKSSIKSINIEVKPFYQNLSIIEPSSLVFLHSNDGFEEDDIFQRLVLSLPMFENLTSLNINFIKPLGSNLTNFAFDERSIENIHQSCSKLEKLKLSYFYMNISEEYENNGDYKNKIIPTKQLKELTITGILMDPKCYSYLSYKYPAITSLHIDFDSKSSYLDYSLPFSSSIYNMITGFPFLKRLSIELIRFETDHQHFFPHNEFILWLQHHPKQLTHLSYSHPLFSSLLSMLSHPPQPLIIPPSQAQQQQRHNHNENKNNKCGRMKSFLNHKIHGCFLKNLTALSLPFDFFVETVKTYFTTHPEITEVSDSVIEIKIYGKGKNNILYIFDWLAIFPKLKILSAYGIGYIKDNEGINDDDNPKIKSFYEDCIKKKNDYFLHHIINKRKLQKQQRDLISNAINKGKNKNETNSIKEAYSLKKLELQNSTCHFKHGLNTFIKRFEKLSELILKDITFSFYDQQQLEQQKMQLHELQGNTHEKLIQELQRDVQKKKQNILLLEQQQKELQQEVLQSQLCDPNSSLLTLQLALDGVSNEVKSLKQQTYIVQELLQWLQNQPRFFNNPLCIGSFPPSMENNLQLYDNPDHGEFSLLEDSILSNDSFSSYVFNDTPFSSYVFNDTPSPPYFFNDIPSSSYVSNNLPSLPNVFNDPPSPSYLFNNPFSSPPRPSRPKRRYASYCEVDEEIQIYLDLSSTVPPPSFWPSSTSLLSHEQTFTSSETPNQRIYGTSLDYGHLYHILKFKSLSLSSLKIESTLQTLFNAIITDMNKNRIIDEIHLDASHLDLDQLTISQVRYLPWHLNNNSGIYSKESVICKMNVKEKKNDREFSIFANDILHSSHANPNAITDGYRCILNIQVNNVNDILFNIIH